MLFVAYGHKLYSHTHSYIHYGFIRAFKALGYDTLWLDSTDTFPNLPENTIILTEGNVDENLPVLPHCYYILHNIKDTKYQVLPPERKYTLQVITDEIYEFTEFQISPGIWYNTQTRAFFMCWATDLLPDEINIIEELNFKPKATWIGSLNECPIFGNYQQVMPFFNLAKSQNFDINIYNNPFSQPLDNQSQRQLIAESLLAPAIVGKWQQEHGYIPCRIFKNISYGTLGITNSKAVYDLFEGAVIYDPDSEKLFHKCLEIIKNKELLLETIKYQMEIVKEHHTYINRAQALLKYIPQ